MTINVSERIRAITDKMIAYSTEHADEIEKDREIAVLESETKINDILKTAETVKKPSYKIYEHFKSLISSAAVTSTQYETAIRSLAAILKI